METYETDQPWVIYRYGLTHDKWWPLWTSTRVLGFARIAVECAVCGKREVIKVRMPRFGPVPEPEGGRHRLRLAFLKAHEHPDRGHPMSWVRPLLNPQAHVGGLNLDLFGMRLEADINESKEK